MAVARGSWTVHEGIQRQWDKFGLDSEFRLFWSDRSDTTYQPLNDGEARPTPPGPYCVYEALPSVIMGHHTGITGTTLQQLQMIGVSFTIHAKTQNVSGKQICRDLAKKVAAAFDPPEIIDFSPDCHIYTIRGPDQSLREGDEEWLWNLNYDFHIDASYNAPQNWDA